MNDLLLLAQLLGGPLHGYGLKKQVGLVSGNPAMHNNLVYPLLRRFVAKGWVKKKKAPGERGQTRVVYSLTPAGRAELLRRLADFGEAEARSAEEFELRVGLFEFLDAATREEILTQRKKYLEGRGEKLAHLQKAMDLGQYGGDVVRFLREQARAELAWLEHLRRMSAAAKGKKARAEGRESR
jgi:DNA-binding PadR family transcriptional regulator